MGGIEVHRRERHTRLHAALQVEQVDLQIDRLRQLGLVLSQLPQFEDLAGLGTGRRGRTVAHDPRF
jgi:hypothetical protein